MPTTNPRVQVTLSPSLDLLVQRMARHGRSSKSQVLRELLEAAEPALQRAVALMDAASKAAQEVHTGLAQSLDRVQTRAERSLAHALEGMERTTADLVAQAEAVKARRPARDARRARGPAAGAPTDPPASNRGVKSAKRAARGPATGGHTKGGRS